MNKWGIRMNIMSVFLVPFFLIIIGAVQLVKDNHNFIIMILSLELITVQVTVIFGFLSFTQNNCFGQIYGIYILTIAAVESAIIISLVVQFYRLKNTISMFHLNKSFNYKVIKDVKN